MSQRLFCLFPCSCCNVHICINSKTHNVTFIFWAWCPHNLMCNGFSLLQFQYIHVGVDSGRPQTWSSMRHCLAPRHPHYDPVCLSADFYWPADLIAQHNPIMRTPFINSLNLYFRSHCDKVNKPKKYTYIQTHEQCQSICCWMNGQFKVNVPLGQVQHPWIDNVGNIKGDVTLHVKFDIKQNKAFI